MLIRSGMGMQLSGSVGGVVAARNRYGAYLRGRSVPVNPGTALQQSARNALSAVSAIWRTLPAASAGQWRDYAAETPRKNRLGETIILSAHAMFCRVNIHRVFCGQTILVAAPSKPGEATYGMLGSISGTGGATTSDIEIVTTASECLGPALIRYSPTISQGVESKQSTLSSYGTAATMITSGGTIAQASVRYGVAQVGERRYVEIQLSAPDGRLAPLITAFVTFA